MVLGEMLRKGTVRLQKLGLLTLFLILSAKASATHLRAGEITVERVNCSSLTFRITITAYTNTNSEIKFGEGILDFGDGGKPEITPTINNTNRPDLGPNIGIVVYTTEHTYSGPGRYVISYIEPNRNGGILNIFNSVETRFYIESVINIDPFLGCNNSPKLLVPPIDKACTSAAWFHNPGAYDPDGDSISFEFTVPKREKGQVVGNYRDPDSKEFYDKGQIPYSTANEAGDGPPTFNIDPQTGTIVWDAPGVQGEYNIAFLIKEWRRVGGIWVLMGYVVRDMQIIVEDCSNQRPELEVPQDICVEAGELITQDIFAFDPDSDSVKIEAFSQVFGINPFPAAMVPQPNSGNVKHLASSPTSHARVVFKWQTDCRHVKEQPYQVVFKVTDKPSKGPKLVQFITWNITVVGPAPKWKDLSIDFASRRASIEWNPYACANAERMEVWRRVAQYAFTPPECVTGMPDFLGYTLLSTVPIAQTKFVDSNGGRGLAVGAQYCYRLVAVFPLPGGGESYMSMDTCLAPITADAPVITNVTIDKTGSTNGIVTVKWRSAFEVNKAQFPPPYTFELYRAEGISGTLKINRAFPGKRTDSTWVDTQLNTDEFIYNYRVVQYDGNGAIVDTSFTASTVRLETKPQLKKIELTWAADVPWSNQSQDYPNHLVYRGSATDTESQLTLIASVDVNKNGYTFVDDGSFENTPLRETETYCYRVMTRGAYGNDNIAEPLENFSQIICAQPNDDKPPCVQELSVTGLSCEEVMKYTVCGHNVFSNTLTWKRPADAECRGDIKSYNIYTADKVGETFSLYVENVRDTVFVDANQNLKSYARCYRITAVDRSGNESEPSEPYCFDNCPHYELPNVFTPTGDNCNELFSAYGDRSSETEEGGGTPTCSVSLTPDQLKEKCARFVQRVNFKVTNRWGKEVFSYESGGERNIYIDWDGRDNNGSELAAGIYYYIAEVTFDVVDPAEETQIIKGWVHLIR